MVDSLSRRRTAISTLFFVLGSLIATWASRIPAMKDQIGLSDNRLGLALLALGAGMVVGLPPTSALMARYGSARVVSASALAGCAILALVGRTTSFALLVPALACFGAALGATDVAVNAQAALLERAVGRSIMSSFHGQFSLGGLVGAGVGGLVARRGWAAASHLPAVSTVLAGLALVATRNLSSEQAPASDGPALAWPSRAIVGIGCVAACGSVVEGGIADWSALYLRDTLRADAGFAASGYAAFSMAMMFGRFGGDRLIDRWGGAPLARTGAAFTGLALAVALWMGNAYVALLAFVLAGLGMSTLFPVVFSAAGGVPGAEGKHAIAAVATMAYGGIVLAPPAIGFLASALSLPIALSLLVVACALIAALGGMLTNRPAAPAWRP